MISDEKYLYATEQLFKSVPIKKIIENCFQCTSKNDEINYKTVPKDLFTLQFVRNNKQYTIDEIEAFYDYYFDDMPKKLYFKNFDCGIFERVNNIANEFLIDINSKPRVSFENLFRWNLVTSKIGEELFTTSFYALEDIKQQRERDNFFWEHIIGTDNNVLNKMFEKGLAENHYHLKGSSCNFICNWVSLMNNIHGRSKDFKELGTDRKTLSKEIYVNTEDILLPFYHLTKIAYVIRLYLFLKYCFIDKKDNQEFYKELEIISSKFNYKNLTVEFNLDRLIDDLESYMNVVRLKSKVFGDSKSDIIDYAILESKFLFKEQDNELSIFFGERYFMYTVLKEMYSNKNMQEKDKNLFYIYCSIKTKFQSEIIQDKENLGFKYFAWFQDRKTMFIKKGSIIEKCLFKLAINTYMKTQNLTSLEARIAPSYSKLDFDREIKIIDKYAVSDLREDKYKNILNTDKSENKENEECLDKFFYTVHMIKEPDKFKKGNGFNFRHIPRNNGVRNNARKAAIALLQVREDGNKSDGNKSTRERIKGIDTCNFEIGTRPDVFSQLYRALRSHNVNNKASICNSFSINDNDFGRIGRTYHVGEDFTDLLDGIRAVDEVLYFLEFKNGDRLGHALALGYDCKSWYATKKNTVTLSKQDLLDNLCWVREKLNLYNIDISVSLSKQIDVKTIELIKELYSDCFKSYKVKDENKDKYQMEIENYISLYSKSIKLRGDNPECYKYGELNRNLMKNYIWDTYNFKEDAELDKIRENPLVCDLYSFYHYNTNTVEEGNKKESYTYTDEFITAISQIQKEMQKEIARKRIAIECNPTSNYFIGNVDKYENHPIVNFNNRTLTNDYEALKNNPQINVSINTDDLGVFNTSLKNEYALIALGLIKAKDAYGNKLFDDDCIYDWLNEIRKNGISQSFMSNS